MRRKCCRSIRPEFLAGDARDPASNIASIADGVNSNRSQTFYDPTNNVTVVTGDGGSIVSARKGVP
jgi:hypothetical protein